MKDMIKELREKHPNFVINILMTKPYVHMIGFGLLNFECFVYSSNDFTFNLPTSIHRSSPTVPPGLV